MDPQPTPFPGMLQVSLRRHSPSSPFNSVVNKFARRAGKRRSVAAPAPSALKAAAPKPKSIATTRAARMATRSPTGNADAAPQPRLPRRAFGTTRSGNAMVEKPPPPLHKPSKVSPPPLKKPAKLSPPPLPKPSKLSPPAMQKPSKMSLPNPVRATKTSRLTAKPLKKVTSGADLKAKAKKRSQRVSFQEAAVGAAAPSGEKLKAYADDVVGHTPMVAMRTGEKPAKVLAAETPFFSAQNCSSWTLDQLESATYWLAQIHMAESVGKHWVAAAFFRLAFECQAQPIHRIQSELRSYTLRHESAGILTPLFDELVTAHGKLVSQPKFDTDGCEKTDTPIASNAVDKNIDTAKLKVDECLKCDLVDVGAIIVDKHDEDAMGQPSFQRKLNESFEFDGSEAVIVDQLDEANFDVLKNAEIEVPCSNEIIQSACRSSTEKYSPRESIAAMASSSGRLSLDNPSDKLSPGVGSSSSKRLSSDLSSEQMPSGSHYDAKHDAIAGAGDHESKVTQDVASEYPA
ncbi:hypothetical protein PVAP13_9KG479100 [Panicum virgatum]|uniref:Uncharacterized protein n=1 Tax=Panicum virgatum TaxID=38727 RepID=A0A8T0NTQ8_PANVG|nr:hypothetical protein PVAP13_9KG479100 [Panicum virgatum]